MDGYALIRWSPNVPWIHSHHGRLGRQQQRLPQRHRLRLPQRHPLRHPRQQHQRWRMRCQELGQVMVQDDLLESRGLFSLWSCPGCFFRKTRPPGFFFSYWTYLCEPGRGVLILKQRSASSSTNDGTKWPDLKMPNWMIHEDIYIYIYHTLKRQYELFLNIFLKTYCM